MFVEMRHSHLPQSRSGVNFFGKEDRPSAGIPLSAVFEESGSYDVNFSEMILALLLRDFSIY